MLAIIITDSSGYTHTHYLPVNGATYTIGRSADCSFPLPGEATLSDTHCQLTVVDGYVYLQDCGSTNGIFIGSRQVTEEYMQVEQEYQMGNCRLMLAHVEEQVSAAPRRAAKLKPKAVTTAPEATAPKRAAKLKPKAVTTSAPIAEETSYTSPAPLPEVVAPEPLPEYKEEAPAPLPEEVAPEPLPEYKEEAPASLPEVVAPEPLPEYKEEAPAPLSEVVAPEPLPEYKEEAPAPLPEVVAPEPLPEYKEEAPAPLPEVVAPEPLPEYKEEAPAPLPEVVAPEPLPEYKEEAPAPLSEVVAPEPLPEYKEEAPAPVITPKSAVQSSSPKRKVTVKKPAAPKVHKELYRPEPPRSGALAQLPRDFSLSLRLVNREKQQKIGTALRFALVADCACHIYLLQYDSEGGAGLLVPGMAGIAHSIPAGVEMQFPNIGLNEYQLMVEPPTGQETIIALACTHPGNLAEVWQQLVEQSTAPLTPGSVEMQAIKSCNTADKAWSSAIIHIRTVV